MNVMQSTVKRRCGFAWILHLHQAMRAIRIGTKSMVIREARILTVGKKVGNTVTNTLT